MQVESFTPENVPDGDTYKVEIAWKHSGEEVLTAYAKSKAWAIAHANRCCEARPDTMRVSVVVNGHHVWSNGRKGAKKRAAVG